ncbi:purine-cytosine permease family protein [Knoellia sp. CPCC 206453]|uniref:purine-cytosine permease family protein n=1 Tax=Knoellia pratensis TaxID=3404796 RepID=UPI00361E2135
MTSAPRSSDDGHPATHDRGSDRFGRVETTGVEYIPESERDSTPGNVFAVFFGGNLAFSVIIFGWLPISFGLSWHSAVTSSFVGLAIGTLLVTPLSLLGPRTGTNNVVSSGAHFGVRGRLIGSLLTLAFALAYAAISVWTAGDALVAAAHRAFGTPDNDLVLALGYGVIALEIVVVASLGHATVVALQKFVIPVIGVLLLLGIVAFAPGFDSARPGGDYLLGSYWSTWFLCVTVSIGGPLSYAPTLGDYTRRVSGAQFSDRIVALASGAGGFLGLFVTAAFGIFTAATFTTLGDSYVRDLVAAAPGWYVLPIVVIALAGGLGQGVLNIYASGLDLEALIPRLKRIHTTLITSAAAVALLYVGVFVIDAVDAITAMTLILNGVAGPWVAINVVGFLVARRGIYDPADLQVFNEGRHGGRYWFTAGWDLRAVVPFAIASVCGVLAVNTTAYVGPLANIAGGVDVSLVGSGLIAAVGYLVTLRLWPEDATPVAPGPELEHADDGIPA